MQHLLLSYFAGRGLQPPDLADAPDPAATHALHRAVELALTGARLSAADAERHGLVNRLTAPGQALAGAREIAELVAANGPLAVAATKQILHESRHWPAAEAFGRQRELSEPVRRSDDAQEGARAFLEKRAPVWNGS